jgi:hypothetical protein
MEEAPEKGKDIDIEIDIDINILISFNQSLHSAMPVE